MASMMVQPFEKSAFSAPAVGVQASLLTAETFLNPAKSCIVVRSLVCVLLGDTAGASNGLVTIRAGAGGTILWESLIAAGANVMGAINLLPVNLKLPAATQLQAQFEAAPGGTTARQSVAVTYYLNDQIEDPAALGAVL